MSLKFFPQSNCFYFSTKSLLLNFSHLRFAPGYRTFPGLNYPCVKTADYLRIVERSRREGPGRTTLWIATLPFREAVLLRRLAIAGFII